MASNFLKVYNGISLTPRDTDPTSPVEGDVQYSDGTHRAKGIWEYRDGDWRRVGGGAGGGLSVFASEDFEETSSADLSSGNNATYNNGGTLVGTLADEETTPIDGERSVKYTQTTGSLNDWVELITPSIDRAEQGKFAKISFRGTYDGNQGDIRFVCTDNTGTELTGSSFTVEQTESDVDKYEAFILIPSAATSLSFGFIVEVENDGAILEVDNVEFDLNTHSEEAIKDIQEYRITQEATSLSDNSGEIQYNLGTASIEDKGQNIIKIEDDSSNSRTKFIAQRKCRIFGSFSAPANNEDVVAYTVNGTVVQFGSGNQNYQRSQTVTITEELEAGDYITLANTSNTAPDTIGGTLSTVSGYEARFKFIAEALSDHVVTPARSNMSDWTKFTPTVSTSMGGVSNHDIYMRRDGSDLLIKGWLIHGSVTSGGPAELDIPLFEGKSITIDTNVAKSLETPLGKAEELFGSLSTLNAAINSVVYNNDSTKVEVVYRSENQKYVSDNANDTLGNNNGLSFDLRIPIEGWSSEAQFLAALPKLEVANTTEKILSADVTSDGDIADLEFNDLTIGNTYILTGYIQTFDSSSGVDNIIEAWSGASKTGDLYGRVHMNAATNTQLSGIPPSLIFTAKSTDLYISGTDIDTIRGNNTKEETFLQLTDVTAEFIKAAPKPLTAILEHRETSGTAGGTYTSGSWQTRPLTDSKGDIGIVDLNTSTGEFTLQPGSYDLEYWGQNYRISANKCRIYNVSDSVPTDIFGSGGANGTSGMTQVMKGKLNLASQKTFRVEVRGAATRSTEGMGFPTNFGEDEIYAQLKITKIP